MRSSSCRRTRSAPTGPGSRSAIPSRSSDTRFSAGTAVDDGQTQLDGRTVERIRIGDTSWYVDPQAFYPIEIHYGYGGVVSILAYEYLPPTSANLALTNIRAQHPNATISG